MQVALYFFVFVLSNKLRLSARHLPTADYVRLNNEA